MSIAMRGGALDETEQSAGITGLMARVSVKGTERRSAAALAEETEALGGSISPSVSSDLFSWSLSLPSRHFAAGFELLADAALRPTFPEAELERERKVSLSDLTQIRDDMYRYPMHLIMQAAFEAHPYGFSTQAMAQAIERHAQADLIAWHRRRVLEGEPWVFIV